MIDSAAPDQTFDFTSDEEEEEKAPITISTQLLKLSTATDDSYGRRNSSTQKSMGDRDRLDSEFYQHVSGMTVLRSYSTDLPQQV